MEVNEIEIPVPWGTVAAKTWGDCSNPLILSIHGWTDNANSFDTLIPHLPNFYYYVCIDLPGHGKSSPVKSTLILTDLDHIVVLKIIYNYLKRERLIIMGHSIGGFLAVTFAQMYPKCVEKLIIFDIFYSYPRPFGLQFEQLMTNFNKRIKYLSKETDELQTYTKEEVFKKIMSSRFTPLSRKAAEVLIDRSIEPVGNGKYKIITAQNVKHMILTTLPVQGYVEYAENYPIKCPHLIILSSSTYFVKFAFRNLEKVFKKNSNYELHVIEGTHEFHIENPENVARIVNKFLIKHQNKL